MGVLHHQLDSRIVPRADLQISDRERDGVHQVAHKIIVQTRKRYTSGVKIWPFSRNREPETRGLVSIADPAILTLLGGGQPSLAGVEVTEGSALGISAVYRAVSLISGSIASLPLQTLRETSEGRHEKVSSFLDNPGGPMGPTPFGWKETVLIHLLLHGNAYLIHVRGGGGQLMALVPVHPMYVGHEQAETWPDGSPVKGGLIYRVTLLNGDLREFDRSALTHIVGMTTDGLIGMSPITVARNALGSSIAADRSAARMFSTGALIAGICTPEDDIDEEDGPAIKEALDRRVLGWENTGSIVVVNRRLKFTPWTMTAADAQFLESRAFQIEDIARWFGVPPHLLMQTDKQTSWGTGVAESNRGMSRTVLAPWACRVEQALSRLLKSDKVEFDFSVLERPTPEQEIDLLAKQVDSGLITLNEARAVRNLPPVPGGDVIRIKGVALGTPATPGIGAA